MNLRGLAIPALVLGAMATCLPRHAPVVRRPRPLVSGAAWPGLALLAARRKADAQRM